MASKRNQNSFKMYLAISVVALAMFLLTLIVYLFVSKKRSEKELHETRSKLKRTTSKMIDKHELLKELKQTLGKAMTANQVLKSELKDKSLKITTLEKQLDEASQKLHESNSNEKLIVSKLTEQQTEIKSLKTTIADMV